jgi:hypothetical protein
MKESLSETVLGNPGQWYVVTTLESKIGILGETGADLKVKVAVWKPGQTAEMYLA